MIRLSRVGKNKRPSYRVVVSEKHKDPWGDYLEQVGFYDPLARPKVVQFEKERVLHWISRGAQASVTVHNLLVSSGIVDGRKLRATKGDIQKRAVAAQAVATQAAADKKAAEDAAVAAEGVTAPAAGTESQNIEPAQEKTDVATAPIAGEALGTATK